MNLHQHPEVFKDAVVATAQAMGIREVFIEKDYWVTLVLYRLANSPYAETTIFKGGTSLSKAFKLIQRFSEDVDLAIVVEEGLSGNQIKKQIEKIEKEICRDFREVAIPGITSKGSRIRRTVHDYGASFGEDFGQASDKILLEVNSFAKPHPHEPREIQSYIGEFMAQQGLTGQAAEFGLALFNVRVVSLSRTFAEKVMAIVRASYSPHRHEELRRKIRHLYDLHQLLRLPETASFVQSASFFELLSDVQADDARNSEFQGEWASLPLAGCGFFRDLPASSAALEGAYRNDFSPLVHGELPAWEDVLKSMRLIRERLAAFDRSSSS